MSRTTTSYGRLCNQIIRNLALSILAEKYDLYVEYSSYDTINNLLGIKLFVGDNKYDNGVGINCGNYMKYYNHHIDSKSNFCFMKDFFQNEEITSILFKHLRDNSKNVIDKNPYKERYENNNDLFLHIRLGDIKHNNVGIEYYKFCIDYIRRENKCDITYIGSDSLNHEMIKKLVSIYPEIILVKKNEVETIQFGSTCKYIVLSHGSFSAIIGYLGFFSDIYFPNKTPGWCPLGMFLNKGFISVDIVKEEDAQNFTWQILPQENQGHSSIVSEE